MAPRAASLLCLSVIVAYASYAHAISTACLQVPAASSDTSTAGVQFMKSNTVHDAVCPGMTYKAFLTFPTNRTYQVISTKGAFQGASSGCTNQMAGTKALKVVDDLKLYFGCAATGSVKISVLSKAPNSAELLLKTVSRPIKALKDCPQSPCVKSATAQTPSTGVTESGSRPASNPTLDAMSAFSMLYAASGVQSTPLGMIINPATALTVFQGLKNLNQTSAQAASTIKTMQALLSMVPGASDNTGFFGGMKNFLGTAADYLPAAGGTGSTSQQASGAVMGLVSSMAGMAGVAFFGEENDPYQNTELMMGALDSMTSLLFLFVPIGNGGSNNDNSGSDVQETGTAPTTTTPLDSTVDSTPIDEAGTGSAGVGTDTTATSGDAMTSTTTEAGSTTTTTETASSSTSSTDSSPSTTTSSTADSTATSSGSDSAGGSSSTDLGTDTGSAGADINDGTGS